MVDVLKASRYIAVAQPTALTNREWKKWYADRNLQYPGPPPETHKDYALLKVLSMLRRDLNARTHVNAFKHDEDEIVRLDFSKLKDSDYIFIVGHGNPKGLYPMGPDADIGMDRLVHILTEDGHLKTKRKDKQAVIVLLSCRAGLGFHKSLARTLFKDKGIKTTSGGALGFTFGSNRTAYLAQNEVLIQGIPWHMEYPGTITVAEAEAHTSAREGKTITVAGKQAEIQQFLVDKRDLENRMKALVGKLRSTEVNAALDELETPKFNSLWLGLLRAQFDLYATAKKQANLEFDMWYDKITDGYVWTSSGKVTDAQAAALLTGTLEPTSAGLTSTR